MWSVFSFFYFLLSTEHNAQQNWWSTRVTIPTEFLAANETNTPCIPVPLNFCRSRSLDPVLSPYFSNIQWMFPLNGCLNPNFTTISTNLCSVWVAPTSMSLMEFFTLLHSAALESRTSSNPFGSAWGRLRQNYKDHWYQKIGATTQNRTETTKIPT